MDCSTALINVLKKVGLLPTSFVPDKDLEATGISLVALAQRGLVDETKAIAEISKQLNVPSVELHNLLELSEAERTNLLAQVPFETWWQHKIVPYRIDATDIFLACANPLDFAALDDLHFVFEKNLRPAIAPESLISRILARHAHKPLLSGQTDQSIESAGMIELVSSVSQPSPSEAQADWPDPASAVGIINRVLREAIEIGVSDIHFDPTPQGIDVRFRLDGVMQHALDVAKALQGSVSSRLKLLSGMNIAEHRKPQDGRIRVLLGGRPVDVRASTIPTCYGEKLVLRLLRSDPQAITFGALGLEQEMHDMLCQDLALPARMILVTGPTGSGKTTTLYAALNHLNDGSTNIETVEDPIEYKVPGINQIQVNEVAGVTFASALRSILRQDPDVIMIGEIRDQETANIALQSAQTGHLVLSTLHTNDAPSTLARLLNLGCDRFILSTSLAGVLAQRLIRRLCQKCKNTTSKPMSQPDIDLLLQYNCKLNQIFESVGCEECRFTGYKGRIGLYSYLRMTSEIAAQICQGASQAEVTQTASQQGFVDLKTAALKALSSGITSFDEVKPYLFEASGHQTQAASTSQGPVDDHEKRTRIILIDEQDASRERFSEALRGAGYRVIEAKNGIEGLSKIKTEQPDLIISGLSLPLLDGKQLLRQLQGDKGEQLELPIVILTSAVSEENELEALRLGAKDFISKDRSPAILLSRISQIIKN